MEGFPDDLVSCHILPKVDDVGVLANLSATCKAFHAMPWPVLRLKGTAAVIQRNLLRRNWIGLQKIHINILSDISSLFNKSPRLECKSLIDQSKSTLQEFSLYGQDSDVDDIWSALKDCPRLSSIKLSRLSIRAGLPTGSCFPALKTLHCINLGSENYQNLLKDAPLLEELTIVSWRLSIEVEGGQYLKSGKEVTVAGCLELQVLSVAGVDNLDLGDDCCLTLREAHLGYINLFDNEKLRKLLSASPSLKELRIEGCPLISLIPSSSSLERLYCKHAERLRIERNVLEKLQIWEDCLLEIDNSSRISHLSVCKCVPPNYGLLSLTRLPFVTNLQCLEVEMAKTAGESILVALLFISKLPCLTTIIIHFNIADHLMFPSDLERDIRYVIMDAFLSSPHLQTIRFCAPRSELERIKLVLDQENQSPGFSYKVTSGCSQHHRDNEMLTVAFENGMAFGCERHPSSTLARELCMKK